MEGAGGCYFSRLITSLSCFKKKKNVSSDVIPQVVE